jgi:lipopolysaccharide biosynthesis glycosyltransferase
MNIVPTSFVIDEFYAPYLSVTLQSIMENAGYENEYLFFVLHLGLSSETMQALKKQVDDFRPSRFSLDFVDCTKYVVAYDFASMIENPMWSKEIFLKLLIPYIFEHYERILYLDSDIIVRADLGNLYEESDERKYPLAAVPEIINISWFYFLKDKPSGKSGKINFSVYDTVKTLPHPESYFCTGVLSINTSRFHALVAMEEILRHATTKKYKLPEQDLLNIICADKVQLLPITYGYPVHNHWLELESLPEKLREEYLLAQADPKIIHFLCKPWTRFFHVEYFYEWWKYATRTPFIGIITQRMRTRKLIGHDSYQGE